MTGHNPEHALSDYIRSVREALQRITLERLELAKRATMLIAGPFDPITIHLDKPFDTSSRQDVFNTGELDMVFAMCEHNRQGERDCMLSLASV